MKKANRIFSPHFKGKALAALLFLFAFSPALDAAIPSRPRGFVSDFAGLLDGAAKSQLTSVIAEAEKKTSAEIAVVTVASLDGMSVEEYAGELFKLWGIGKKGKDNGVLVLVAPNERKVRIEVGYGLEPILPDGLAGQIIREEFAPAFKRSDFAGGILSGVAAIAEIIKKGEPASKPKGGKLSSQDRGRLLEVIILSFFIVPLFMLRIATLWGWRGGGRWRGGGFSGGGFSGGGGGFGGFGGGSSGGGGASGRW